jgi:hypothetical protein
MRVYQKFKIFDVRRKVLRLYEELLLNFKKHLGHSLLYEGLKVILKASRSSDVSAQFIRNLFSVLDKEWSRLLENYIAIFSLESLWRDVLLKIIDGSVVDFHGDLVFEKAEALGSQFFVLFDVTIDSDEAESTVDGILY